jgi:uncharacterized membrane protein YidH (DUF202 family)
MDGLKILGIILIIAGVLGLVFGGFTYTRARADAEIGPIEVAVEDRERVNVPVWVGVGAIVVGGLVLVGAGRRR